MTQGEERRKFARLNILVDVAYTREDGREKEKLTLTRNISRGGVCFVGYEQLHESDVINLNIYLPERKESITATGKVVWVKEFSVGDITKKRYDVGVEFISIKPEDLAALDKYMLKHLA